MVSDRLAELTGRGVQSADIDLRLVGGFTLVGGNGFDLRPGCTCSVLALPESARVQAELGGRGVAIFPYAELAAVDVKGGARTTGGGFFGGGFGLTGAAEGMIAASVLNALTTKTTVNSGMHLGSRSGEVLLHHGEFTSTELRTALSPLFSRYDAARHAAATGADRGDDPLASLERLAHLKDSGVISDAEFQLARAKYVQQLTQTNE